MGLLLFLGLNHKNNLNLIYTAVHVCQEGIHWGGSNDVMECQLLCWHSGYVLLTGVNFCNWCWPSLIVQCMCCCIKRLSSGISFNDAPGHLKIVGLCIYPIRKRHSLEWINESKGSNSWQNCWLPQNAAWLTDIIQSQFACIVHCLESFITDID